MTSCRYLSKYLKLLLIIDRFWKLIKLSRQYYNSFKCIFYYIPPPLFHTWNQGIIKRTMVISIDFPTTRPLLSWSFENIFKCSQVLYALLLFQESRLWMMSDHYFNWFFGFPYYLDLFHHLWVVPPGYLELLLLLLQALLNVCPHLSG